MVEIRKLGVALGGEKETFYGLSGLGDLIVTCLSEHSRNRRAGSAALNTNLFSLLTNASSKSPIFRKNSPRRRVRKMGIVAFRQKTRFSIIKNPPLINIK